MGPRRHIVFDTNVLVSAIGWRGNEHELYNLCRSGDPRLATSPALLEELRRVLKYPKFAFAETEIEAFITDVLGYARIVSPSETLEVVKEDPGDNRVLECAVTVGACLIVSGDKHLLDLEQYEGIRIIGAREALVELANQ
jgi:putative PIN family toxin of toxin-antitoxin system